MTDTTKGPVVEADTYDAEIDIADDDVAVVTEKKGTAADRRAMWRMGKVQEMRVSA
jgi:hypothetical protein